MEKGKFESNGNARQRLAFGQRGRWQCFTAVATDGTPVGMALDRRALATEPPQN